MTAPAAPRVAPAPTHTRALQGGGESGPGPPRGPPELPSRLGHLPSLPGPAFHGSRLRVPARLNPRAKSPALPLPLQGRYSRLRRGGVCIKGLRSPRRGESATGPEPKDGPLKPQVPEPPRFLSLLL